MDTSSNTTLIRPWFAAVMYFLAFEGVFLIAWTLLFCFGYPTGVLGEQTYQTLYRIKALLFPVFLFVVVVCYRKNGFKGFVGLSWPILVFLIMEYCRICSYSWAHGTLTWISIGCSWIVPIVAFTVPISEKAEKYAFSAFYGTLIGYALLFLAIFTTDLFSGNSFRHLYNPKYLPVIESLFGKQFTYQIFNTIPMTGALLGLIAYWLWQENKIHWLALLAAYVPSTFFICFSGTKISFLAWAFLHVLVFAISLSKRKKTVLTLLMGTMLCLINISTLAFVSKDHYCMGKRFGELAGTATFMKRTIETSLTDPGRDKEPDFPDGQPPAPGASGDAASSGRKMTFAQMWHSLTPLVVDCNNPSLKKVQLLRGREYWELADKYGCDGRLVFYMMAVIQISRHPLTGSTNGDLVFDRGEGPRLWTVHNAYLQAFISTGVIGGFLFLFIAVRGFVDSLIVFYRKPEYAWLGIVFLYAAVFYSTWPGLLSLHFWLPVVALRACVATLPKNRDLPAPSEISTANSPTA